MRTIKKKRKSLNKKDDVLWLGAGLFIFIALLFWFRIDPAEDPHIIFRYAENLSKGLGIVYNETPVEGATEFLWMIFLSGMHKIGFNLPSISQTSNIIISLMLLIILYKQGASAITMALSPLAVWSLSGFGTPLFALLMLLMFISAKKGQHLQTMIFGVLLGLARPEGAFLLLGVVLVNRIPIRYLWFGLIGVAYHAWRYYYFGYLFPNTFYVKHAGSFFHPEGLLAVGILYAVILSLYPKKHKLLIPLLIFPIMYLITDQSQNIGMRFQFSILPSLLLFVPRRKWYGFVVPIVIMASTYMRVDASGIRSDADTHYDTRKTIGENLSVFKKTAIVTEAGWFPYYSKWRVIDAVGLNDVYIAHHGLDTAYLSSQSPKLIMFRAYTSQGYGDTTVNWGSTTHWNRIVQTLYMYALTHDFELQAQTGSSRDCLWWFIKE